MVLDDSTVANALKIATKAHKGQIDKAGVPYIEHPKKVASFVHTPIEKVVALLHDVVEDTDYTFKDLQNEGVPAEAIEALRLLTHNENTDYIDYIDSIIKSENKLAITVKMADLKHNMDISRLNGKKPPKYEIYKLCYERLKNAR